MRKVSRRQWLMQLGGVVFCSTAFSSCRLSLSDKVSEISFGMAKEYEPISENACMDCGNCMPCEYGIDIPGNLLFVGDALKGGYMPGLLSDTDFKPKGSVFLARYEAVLSDPEQSQHCISCGACLETCPVGIDIPAALSRITVLTDLLRNLRCIES